MMAMARLILVISLVFWVPVLAILFIPFHITLFPMWVLTGMDCADYKFFGMRLTNKE